MFVFNLKHIIPNREIYLLHSYSAQVPFSLTFDFAATTLTQHAYTLKKPKTQPYIKHTLSNSAPFPPICFAFSVRAKHTHSSTHTHSHTILALAILHLFSASSLYSFKTRTSQRNSFFFLKEENCFNSALLLFKLLNPSADLVPHRPINKSIRTHSRQHVWP